MTWTIFRPEIVGGIWELAFAPRFRLNHAFPFCDLAVWSSSASLDSVVDRRMMFFAMFQDLEFMRTPIRTDLEAAPCPKPTERLVCEVIAGDDRAHFLILVITSTCTFPMWLSIPIVEPVAVYDLCHTIFVLVQSDFIQHP